MGKSRKPVPQAAPEPPARRPVDLYVCLALALAALAVYAQAAGFAFLNYDDGTYVTANVHVRNGFSWPELAWAFTAFHAGNWSPLAWISHMADCQWFGLHAGAHHVTSAVLHAMAAILLFAALEALSGARWPSAFVAFLFALHPLHVESVAWIAERKDVLCALLWFLALWLYARYVRRPSVARYTLVALAFALGLMAKAMIVTLPFTLLLLDFWPLGRAPRWMLVWEKLPLLALTGAASVLALLAQKRGHAVIALASVPVALRIENALTACAGYLLHTIWPVDLAVFYPYRFNLPMWQVAASALVLAAITAMVLRELRRRPYLAVGWFWFLGTLVPVIGLVQVGAQASADRYMYVPLVGLAIMAAWRGAEFAARSGRAVPAIAIGVLAACALASAAQLRYWSDSETLFIHALAVTSGNAIAHNNLAEFELEHGRTQDAVAHIEAALRIRPDYAEARANLAVAYRAVGRLEDSAREYRAALQLLPGDARLHDGFGGLLVAEGDATAALDEFAAAIRLNPESAESHFHRGRVLAGIGRAGDAIAEYRATIRLRPDIAEVRHALGFILLTRGHVEEALAEFRTEAALKPEDAVAHYNLGTVLASAGRREEALAEFTRALAIRPDFAEARQRADALRSGW